MELDSKIYVAGHNGMVGSAICRLLQSKGYTNVSTVSSDIVDLTDSYCVNRYFDDIQPEYVFLCAAKVGGILSNDTYPVDFLLNNLKIETNIIENCHRVAVKKLLFLGSSCIYPKFAVQPIEEKSLLTGALEYTNQWYAIAKIAGIKLCQAYRKQYGNNFICVMPTNLYGPNDHYHLNNSHVLPALLHKFHNASKNNDPEVICWGTGQAKREFLHVDDFASACLLLMEKYNSEEIINVGSGYDISIAYLADLIRSVVGYTGDVIWDISKPDGTPRKLLDNSKILSLGWKPSINLYKGLRSTYEDFKKNWRE